MRTLDAELNLVPFIDLLSVCITFLLVTAVWTTVSAMAVDQAVSDTPAVADDDAPLLTVHVRADGVSVGRDASETTELPRVGDAYDWVGVGAALEGDRARYPDATDIVLTTDDGVPYEHMIEALDLTRAHGYTDTRIAGAPAAL